MEHKITTENILKAAEKCPQAKEALKTLFPEVFEKQKYLDLSKLKITNDDDLSKLFSIDSVELVAGCNYLLWISEGGKFAGKSFCLAPEFDWELKLNESRMRLIPTRK